MIFYFKDQTYSDLSIQAHSRLLLSESVSAKKALSNYRLEFPKIFRRFRNYILFWKWNCQILGSVQVYLFEPDFEVWTGFPRQQSFQQRLRVHIVPFCYLRRTINFEVFKLNLEIDNAKTWLDTDDTVNIERENWRYVSLNQFWRFGLKKPSKI